MTIVSHYSTMEFLNVLYSTYNICIKIFYDNCSNTFANHLYVFLRRIISKEIDFFFFSNLIPFDKIFHKISPHT